MRLFGQHKPQVCAPFREPGPGLGRSKKLCLTVSIPLIGMWTFIFFQTHEKDSLLPVLFEMVERISATIRLISGFLVNSGTRISIEVAKKLGFPSGLVVKNPFTVQELQESWVRSLGREDALEEGRATHSNVLAWRIPCTEEPGGL